MKTLEKIPETYSKELINDIHIFFENENYNYEKYSVVKFCMTTIEKWYEIYESLKKLFKKYYIIDDDNYDLEIPENVLYGGGSCKLINKYKEKYIKDVCEIIIRSAYSQKINKLLLEGMQSNDSYFPYIFNIMYVHIGKTSKPSLANIFINVTYGVLTMNKEKHTNEFPYLPRVDKDIKKEVTLYYRNIMESIDEKLYYYLDTDSIYLHKDNIDEVSKVFEDNDIDFYVETPSNYLFIDRKKYIEIKDGKVKNIKGLRFSELYDKFEKIDGKLVRK